MIYIILISGIIMFSCAIYWMVRDKYPTPFQEVAIPYWLVYGGVAVAMSIAQIYIQWSTHKAKNPSTTRPHPPPHMLNTTPRQQRTSRASTQPAGSTAQRERGERGKTLKRMLSEQSGAEQSRGEYPGRGRGGLVGALTTTQMYEIIETTKIENRIKIFAMSQADLFGEFPKKVNDDFLSNQLIKLGDMMGDGLHHEADGKWIEREYKRIAKLLHPEIYTDISKRKVAARNEQMRALLKDFRCTCSGVVKQVRSGSKTCECLICGKRYQAGSKKK